MRLLLSDTLTSCPQTVEIDLAQSVARCVEFGKRCGALDGESGDFIARYINLGQCGKAREIECAGKMFVFPLYRGYMAPFDSNALPGGRITGIGDFRACALVASFLLVPKGTPEVV